MKSNALFVLAPLCTIVSASCLRTSYLLEDSIHGTTSTRLAIDVSDSSGVSDNQTPGLCLFISLVNVNVYMSVFMFT